VIADQINSNQTCDDADLDGNDPVFLFDEGDQDRDDQAEQIYDFDKNMKYIKSFYVRSSFHDW
jgi:hypothetical protein